MNYELAKKLKEAGFPQRRGCSACLNGYTWENGQNIDELIYSGDYVSKPTLSELIEACGKQLMLLIKEEECLAKLNTINGFWEEIGKTPEEAVANLWLEINK